MIEELKYRLAVLKVHLNLRMQLTRLAFWWIKRQMQRDRGWAWSWHCNVAMAFYDADAERSHAVANEGAAKFMERAFDINVREFPEYRA